MESGLLTEEQRQLLRSASQGREAAAEFGSPKHADGIKLLKANAGASAKAGDRKSHSGKNGRPKKGGGGGKGTWGSLLDADGKLQVDRNDPNYDSEEEPYKLVGAPIAQSLEQYKEKVVTIVEEYFVADDVAEAAAGLRDLGSPNYHHHFVKKIVSMALDRHDREKEMASVLLSALYADVIQPDQVAKGFTKLLEAADDLALDIPDAADILALFLARSVVDDILPPVFLSKTVKLLPEGSLGVEVIQKADKTYLLAPHHAEIVERRWGGTTHVTVEEMKRRIGELLSEYVESGDKAEACRSIRELNVPFFHHEVVKKALTLAMEKRKAEPLILSLLHETADEGLITSSQMSKGFTRLSDALEDLALDIPHAKEMWQGLVSKAKENGWLSSAFAAEAHEPTDGKRNGSVGARAGGAAHVSVEETESGIRQLLSEYVESGDNAEACRSIRDLNVPFFHHEVVKQALSIAVEKSEAEPCIFSLLQEAAEEGLITSSQMSKGFTRFLDAVGDLPVDAARAKEVSQSLVAKAKEAGWLGHTFSRTISSDLAVRRFKQSATTIIQEYFLSDDIAEVIMSLEDLAAPEFYAVFVKQLVTRAMDRKNHEKEMASVLLSALYAEVIPVEQIRRGFILLLESAEDTALDIPDAANQLALFLSRAVVDDILAPLDLADIDEQLEGKSLGREIVHSARALLSARHAGERVLRCWGGGTGRAVEDARDKIIKLLEEFAAGGELLEACQCIRDLNMSSFHHEVVKRALLMAMEKKSDRLLSLLQECSSEGLITTSQMLKGFTRVADALDDFALDFPAAKGKFASIVKQAKEAGWLSAAFAQDTKSVLPNGVENGSAVHSNGNGIGQPSKASH